MKFDELFPNVKPGELVIDVYEEIKETGNAGYFYQKSGTPDFCAVCGNKCTWIETNAAEMVCSEECDLVMWKKFQEESEKSNNELLPLIDRVKNYFVCQFTKLFK